MWKTFSFALKSNWIFPFFVVLFNLSINMWTSSFSYLIEITSIDWRRERGFTTPHIWYFQINPPFLLCCSAKGFPISAYKITPLIWLLRSLFDQAIAAQKLTKSVFIVFASVLTDKMMQWCHLQCFLVYQKSQFIDLDEVEKGENHETADVYSSSCGFVDLKYKMLWCMLEISAVNMPSIKKQVSYRSFFYAFHSHFFLLHNLFALRIF